MDSARLTLIERDPSPQPGYDAPLAEPVVCTADLAECTCPDFCERDHTNE